MTLNHESYFEVTETNACRPQARKLNAIVEECIGSKGALVCHETEVPSKHTVLRAMSAKQCNTTRNALNKLLVDFKAYADSGFGTLQCTPEGFLKDSTDDHKKCSVTAEILNRAIDLYVSGDYRDCDYTTATTTPTGSLRTTVTTTQTTTATSTATTAMYGNLECFKHEGTGYLRSVTECSVQSTAINNVVEACGAGGQGTSCAGVGDEYVLKATHDRCSAVATSLNTAVGEIAFPNHAKFSAGVNCTLEGYLTVGLEKCADVAGFLNNAIDDYLSDKFLACSLSSFTTTATSSVSSTATTSVSSSATSSQSSTVSTSQTSSQSSSATTTASTSVSSTQSSTESSTVKTTATTSATSSASTTESTTAATPGSSTLTSTISSTPTTSVTSTVTTSMFLAIRYYSPDRGEIDVSAATEIVLTFPLRVRAGDGYIIFTPQPASIGIKATEIRIKDTSQVSFSTAIIKSQPMGVVRIQPTNPLRVGQEALKYRVTITPKSVLEQGDSDLEFKGLSIHDYQFTLKDTVSPGIVATSPAAGEENVAVNVDSLVLTFNEPVSLSGSGTMTIARTTAETGTTSLVYTANNVTLANNENEYTVKPAESASSAFFVSSLSGAQYTVTIDKGFFVDAGENQFAGISGGSYTFSVADGTAPSMLMDTLVPANNSVGVNATTAVIMHFDEPVTANEGNIVIEGLGEGGDDATCTVAIVDTTQVTINDKIVTVQCDEGLAGGPTGRTFQVLFEKGAVVDNAATPNKFAGTAAGEYIFAVADTQAPTIVSLQPRPRQHHVALDAALVMSFTETVVQGTGSIKLVPVSAGDTVVIDISDTSQVTFNSTAQIVSVNPTTPFASDIQGQTYHVEVDPGAIVDRNGLAFAGFTSGQWVFHVVDAVAPSLQKIRPRDGSAGVATNAQFILTFDEPMAKGSGEIYIVSTYPSEHKITIDVQGDEVFISDNIVRIIPFEQMDPGFGGREYTVECASGVLVDSSKSANPFQGFLGSGYTFTVADVREPFITAFSPIRAATKVERNTSIIFTMSEKVSQGNGYITLLPSETEKVKIHVSESDKIVFDGYTVTILASINLSPGAMGQAYHVEVDDGAILDLSGNLLPPLYGNDYYFRMDDDVDPSVVQVLPNIATGNIINYMESDVVITFTEPIFVSNQWKHLYVLPNETETLKTFLYTILDIDANTTTDYWLSETDWDVTGSELTLKTPFARLAPLQVATKITLEFPTTYLEDVSGNFVNSSLPSMSMTYILKDIKRPELVVDLLLPTAGERDVNRDTSIRLHFNEPVVAHIGNIIIQGLGENGDAATCIVAIIDTTQVTIDGNVVTVQCDGGLDGGPIGRTFQVLVEEGALLDRAEDPNAFGGTVAGEYVFTIDDTSPPIVDKVLPADLPAGVPLDSPFVLTFNEKVQVRNASGFIVFAPSTTGPTIKIHVNDSTQIRVANREPYTLTVTPTVPFTSALETQTYTASITNDVFEDVQGNAYGGIEHIFTVEDRVGPSVTNVSPVDGAATILRHSTIILTFDQPIARGAGTVFIQSTTDDSEVWQIDAGDSQLSLDGTVLTVDPFPALLRSHGDYETYAVTLERGVVQDLAASPNVYDGNANITIFTVINSFQNVSVAPTATAAGGNTAVRISFVTLTEINNFDSIVLTLPKTNEDDVGFNFDATRLSSGFANIHPLFTMHFVYGDSSNGYIVIQKIGGQLIEASSLVEFALSGIYLPRVLGTTGNYMLQTMDVKGQIQEQYVTIPGTNITNDHPPKFEKDAYTFTMLETAIYEQCGDTVTFKQLSARLESSGACTPTEFTPTAVGVLTADDVDSIPSESATVLYSIVGGEGSNYFSLDSETGALTTKNYVDFEGPRPVGWDGKTEFTITVQAVDASPPFRSSTVPVTIVIEDANDHSPDFFLPQGQTYFDAIVHATEAPAGQTVAILTATDGDVGVNAQLKYELDDTVVGFTVNKFTGEIKRNNDQLSSTATYATFYAYVQDTPPFPQQPRVGGALVNVKVISDANLIFNDVAYSGGSKFNKDTYEASMTAMLCSTGTCVVKVWSAPGVISGELIDASPPVDPSGFAPVSYYVDGVQPEPETRTVVQEVVKLSIGGEFSENILDELSPTTKQELIDDMKKRLAESSGLAAESLGVARLVVVRRRRKKNRERRGDLYYDDDAYWDEDCTDCWELQVVFELPEEVDQSAAANALQKYNDDVEASEPIAFTTKSGVTVKTTPRKAVPAPPVATVVTLPVGLDASSSTLFTADDVVGMMEDPAVEKTMAELSESMGFQNVITDAANFVPATTTTTTIFSDTNKTNADADDNTNVMFAEAGLWGLDSTAILAIFATLAALSVCGFAAACIFGCSCCRRGDNGKLNALNALIANESMASNAAMMPQMPIMQGPITPEMAYAGPAGPPMVGQLPYFDVVPEVQENNEFDYNMDDELTNYGHGQDIQYIMDGGNPTSLMNSGGVGNWANAGYEEGQGYNEETYGYGEDQGYGQEAYGQEGYGADQGYPAEAYDQQGMAVLYDQDQEYFEQQFENPLHDPQAGGNW